MPAPPLRQCLTQKEAYHLILPEGPFKQAKYDIIQFFNSNQAVDLIYRGKDYYDVFCFGFSANNSIGINTFLNNIDDFKKFTLFFKEKASFLIKTAAKSIILLPESMRGINMDFLQGKTPTDKNISIECSVSKKYYLNTPIGEITLTKREVDCIVYLLRGGSFKEIGLRLGLSPRTVETYLNNAQLKLRCQTKSQLIEILIDSYPLLK